MASATASLLDHTEDGKLYDLEFGDTWNLGGGGGGNESSTSKVAYHTVKYDFKPASVVKSEQAELSVGQNQDVSITLPNVEGSSTKFSGSTKSYTPKECLLIIDPRTGKMTLERLSANIRVKNVRTENRTASTVKPLPARPLTNDSQSSNTSDKKPAKVATAKPTKTTTQKATTNTKPVVNAPVKPMPSKRPSSPMDDRLSDGEFSPSPTTTTVPSAFPSIQPPPAPTAQPNAFTRRQSHTTLEDDLRLSDTSDDDDDQL